MTPNSHHPTQPQPAAQSASQGPADGTLQRALEQNVAATDTVKQSADELLVINAVLKQEIPDEVQTGELAQALHKTDALEVKIQDTAQDLAEVNEALTQEIAERNVLEQKLAAAQAALTKAKATAQA